MELSKDLELEQPELNELGTENDHDQPDNEPVTYNRSNPSHIHSLKFANRFLQFELTGNHPSECWELFNAILSHEAIKKSNDLTLELAPEELKQSKKPEVKETKPQQGSYLG